MVIPFTHMCSTIIFPVHTLVLYMLETIFQNRNPKHRHSHYKKVPFSSKNSEIETLFTSRAGRGLCWKGHPFTAIFWSVMLLIYTAVHCDYFGICISRHHSCVHLCLAATALWSYMYSPAPCLPRTISSPLCRTVYSIGILNKCLISLYLFQMLSLPQDLAAFSRTERQQFAYPIICLAPSSILLLELFELTALMYFFVTVF